MFPSYVLLRVFMQPIHTLFGQCCCMFIVLHISVPTNTFRDSSFIPTLEQPNSKQCAMASVQGMAIDVHLRILSPNVRRGVVFFSLTFSFKCGPRQAFVCLGRLTFDKKKCYPAAKRRIAYTTSKGLGSISHHLEYWPVTSEMECVAKRLSICGVSRIELCRKCQYDRKMSHQSKQWTKEHWTELSWKSCAIKDLPDCCFEDHPDVGLSVKEIGEPDGKSMWHE